VSAVAVKGALRTPASGGPSRGFPGCQNRHPQRMFPATGGVVAVGKNCDPTGVAVEQASNIARGTPTISAESRQLNTMPRHREVPEHAGPMRPGVPRAPLSGTRRNGMKPRAYPAPT
jgi:hypothetical protein